MRNTGIKIKKEKFRMIFSRPLAAGLLILGSCGLSGCALQSDVRILEDRVIALERRNLELQQKNAESEREKSQIKSQIQDYSQTLEAKEQALRSQSAELQAMADKLRNEIQVLRGKLEETDYLLNRRIRNLENTEKNTRQQLERLEQHLNLDPMQPAAAIPDSPAAYNYDPAAEKTQSASANQEKSAIPAPVSSLSDEKLYSYARQLFEKGEFGKARENFHALLQKYPDTQHADNALFWIGESYYREGRYDSAILEYQTVIEKYPGGNKVPDALLKQGFAFDVLGDRNSAKMILQELMEKYPGSRQARLAQKKLDSF